MDNSLSDDGGLGFDIIPDPNIILNPATISDPNIGLFFGDMI